MPDDKLKLTLNLEPTDETNDGKAQAKAAQARKQSANETMDEAWERIFSGKNISATDRQRLTEVKDAMDSGEIGREPAKADRKQPKFSKAEALRLYKALAERKKADRLREMVENTPDNYVLIQTEEQLAELVQQLSAEEEIAVDTETTGVNVYTDVIVGMSFSLPKANRHVYIPVDHEGITQLSLEYVLDGLHDVLYDDNIGKVLHNAIFDIAMFRRHGSDLRGVIWDTMTAMHLLNENEPSFKLKDLAPKYLRVESDTFDTLFGKDAQFREVPIDIALVYAAKDTELTWKLYEFQRKHMERMPTILEYYQSVEVPLLYVIVELEANGYVLDLNYAKEYGDELRKRAEELAEWLVETLTPYHDEDEPINLNSPAQMKPAVSKAIGKELPNMDAKKTLKPLAKDHEVIAKLLEYKKVTKLSGTYIDALPTKQNPTTKRWHSRFNPMGTVTGRFSSGKDEEDTTGQGFNVQNQSPESRRMFVAPKGKVIIGADFKAQEIRCVAYLSGEPVLIEAFKAGRDPYAMMAANFYKRPYEEVYKLPNGDDTKERKEMKVVWLATLYGMSIFSLADMLGVKKDEADRFQKDLFESMPKLNAWIEGNKEFVKKHGFVWADHKFRKRRLPDATLAKKNIPYGKYNDPKYTEHRLHNSSINRSMRQATNARVQGSSSIQTKVTMIKLHDYCMSKPGWSLWASVHDECLVEAPENFTPEEGEDIRRIMLESYRWGDEVANGTDMEVIKRWGEGVPIDEWFKNDDA